VTDRTVSVALQAKVSGFVSGVNTARANMRAFNDELGKSAKKRQALADLGSTAGKIGLAAAAGLGVIVAAAARFDKSMSGVAATGDDARAHLDELRDAAIKAGAATQFSATEAADGITALAKAGVSATDVLGGGLAGALDLAAAGELGVGQAAETAASAMTQFKLAGKDVPHIADLLAAGAGKAQGEVSDLAMALNQSGLVAAQTGLSIEETTGALSSFASAGLLGSDAGTSFKTMLLSLTGKSEKAKDLMEALGISAYDASGEFVGLTTFSQRLHDGLDNLSSAQRNAALQTIFGTDAIRAANILYNQGGDGIQSWIDKVNDQGYAAEVAGIKMDNLSGDLEKLKGSLETFLIGAGEGSQGPLRKLVQGGEDAVNVLNKIPGPLKDVGTGLLAITAITGGALWFGVKVQSAIIATKANLSTLGLTATATKGKLAGMSSAMAGPWGIALAGGITALTIFATKSAEAAQKAAELRDTLDEQTGAVTENTREWVKKELFDNRVLDTAKRSGLDLAKVTDAALGQADAVAYLNEQLQASIALDAEMGRGTNQQTNGIYAVIDAVTGQSSALQEGIKQKSLLVEADGEATDSAEHLTGAHKRAAGAAREQAASIDKLKTAISALDGLLDKRGALIAYAQSLRDMRDAIKDGGKDFRLTTEAGLKNRAALDAVAKAAEELSTKVTPLERQRVLKDAIQDLLDFAGKSESARRYAQPLIEKLRELERSDPDIKIALDAQEALRRARELRDEIGRLHGKELLITIITNHQDNQLEALGQADGGPVRGPGGPRDDRVLRRLSNGEHVWTAREVAAAGGHGAVQGLRNAVLNRSSAPAMRAPLSANGGETRQLRQAVADLQKELRNIGHEVRQGAEAGTYKGSSAGSRAGIEGRMHARDQQSYLSTGGL